jgi:hypothetical protein
LLPGPLLRPLQPETLEHVTDRLIPIERLLLAALFRVGSGQAGPISRISKKPSIA